MNSKPLLAAEKKLLVIGLCWLLLLNKAVYFLDASSRTRRTNVRSQQKIALAVVSSFIHNKPNTMCNLKYNSGIAAALRKSSITISDIAQWHTSIDHKNAGSIAK